MFVFILLGACISMKLVTSNPLTQSIQSCPGTNYQQIQPYETFVIQPGNYHPYPQLLIQDPYNQPSLTEQISQIFWEKLLSHPTVRSILDTHIYDQNLNTQTNPSNPHTTEVVNNYIVVSSDYITINETEQLPKSNILSNDFNTPNKAKLVKDFKERKEAIASKNRKKKVLDPKDEKDAVLNPDKPRKVKKNLDINTFSLENIKCYTPAEVLDEGVKSPVKKNCRNKEHKEKGQKRKEKQPNKAKSEKDSKTVSKKSTKRNKAKKKIKENCKETNGNTSTKTANGRKYKKKQDGVNNCDCKKVADVMENKSKVKETTIRSCNEETDDLFNLNQYCSALENRCTRNSKHDSVKDSRNKYSDLPDDISINYASYINDLFSNTKAPNSNLFYGSNMYPFDFSQMYQIPQYSNIDISKQQGNKSKKRKKKQKKKNSTRKKKEENSNEEKVTKKSNKINVDNVNVNNNNSNIENDSLKNNDKNDFFRKIGNGINVENVIKKPEITNELENVEVTTKTMNITETTTTIPTIPTTMITEITTEKSTTTSKSYTEQITSDIKDGSESFEDPIQEVEIIQTLGTDDRKQKLIITESPKEILIKIYEKQIPETNVMTNRDAAELLGNREIIKEEEFFEPPTSLDTYSFNKVSRLGFLDGIPSIFHDEIIDDYYPDFTADNHAYLVSEEEMDLRNIHDRYFYTTHKTIDSEIFKVPDLTRSSKNTEHGLHNDKTIEIDDRRSKLRDINNNKVEHNENRRKFKDEEITFMTPPGLDIPGFITRKINIDKGDSNEIFYQHNNDYKHLDNFADKSDHSFKTERYDNTEDKKQGSVVETVYARSKVVKYGQGQNFGTSLNENKTLDEDGVKKGGKTIIIAKSISPEDFWQYQ